MAKNIYVGNMNYETTEDELKELFGQHGEVISAKIIFDRMTQRSKGFGFVEMTNDGEAENAISTLNGFEFKGRALRVNPAREKNNSF